jgi:hypothetical protein
LAGLSQIASLQRFPHFVEFLCVLQRQVGGPASFRLEPFDLDGGSVLTFINELCAVPSPHGLLLEKSFVQRLASGL